MPFLQKYSVLYCKCSPSEECFQIRSSLISVHLATKCIVSSAIGSDQLYHIIKQEEWQNSEFFGEPLKSPLPTSESNLDLALWFLLSNPLLIRGTLSILSNTSRETFSFLACIINLYFESTQSSWFS